jgi:hypothetical protein
MAITPIDDFEKFPQICLTNIVTKRMLLRPRRSKSQAEKRVGGSNAIESGDEKKGTPFISIIQASKSIFSLLVIVP